MLFSEIENIDFVQMEIAICLPTFPRLVPRTKKTHQMKQAKTLANQFKLIANVGNFIVSPVLSHGMLRSVVISFKFGMKLHQCSK